MAVVQVLAVLAKRPAALVVVCGQWSGKRAWSAWIAMVALAARSVGISRYI